MELDAQGVKLSTPEVDALASKLAQLARVTMSVQVGELASQWVIIASSIAYLLTMETQAATVGTMEWALRHQVPLRTVQYQCAKGHLPALKDDTGRWRIKVEAA